GPAAALRSAVLIPGGAAVRRLPGRTGLGRYRRLAPPDPRAGPHGPRGRRHRPGLRFRRRSAHRRRRPPGAPCRRHHRPVLRRRSGRPHRLVPTHSGRRPLMDKTRLLATVAAMTATAGLLAACAPGSGTPSESESTAVEPSDINTDLSSLGDITLTVWDQLVRGGQNEQIQRLNEAFMEKYPNIHIERVSQSFDDLETPLRGAITGNEAPDVVQANNGRGTMGAFVSAGLLRNLDPYAQAYGWGDRFSEDVLAVSRYSSDGVTFGEGNLYGLPQVGEIVGAYYSRSALEKVAGEDELLGGDFATFTDILARAKKEGLTPLQLATWKAGRRCTCSVRSRPSTCRPRRSAPWRWAMRERPGSATAISLPPSNWPTGPRRATSTKASTAPTTTPPGSTSPPGRACSSSPGPGWLRTCRRRWVMTSASSSRRPPRAICPPPVPPGF